MKSRLFSFFAQVRLFHKGITLCLVSGLLLCGQSAKAETFDYYAANLDILQSKKVQKAIGVTEAQRVRMNQFAGAYTTQLKSYQAELVKAKKTQADSKKIIAWRQDFQLKIFSQLTPVQLKRLREISLQVKGVSALADDRVAKVVGLSEPQVKKIRDDLVEDAKKVGKLETAIRTPVINKYKNLNPKTVVEKKVLLEKFKAEMGKAMAAHQVQANQIIQSSRNRILAVLTPKQKSTWSGLLGALLKD